MKRPDRVMAEADPQEWHYAGALALDRLRANHDALVGAIQSAGAEVVFLNDDADGLADAVFTHDPSLVTQAGAVVLRMGKDLRRGEERLHNHFYKSSDIPILGSIEEPGTVEAGDCVWVDDKTLFVGMGFRTNEPGASQLATILAPLGVTVQAYDLPAHLGSAACLHLMSLISLLDNDLALIYEPLTPVRLIHDLQSSGFHCLRAPEFEFVASASLSVNILALAPRRCVMVDGFPETTECMQGAGCDVVTFPGDELCLKAEGGPTCLTRPLLRSD